MVDRNGNDWLGEYALPIGTGGMRYGMLRVHYNDPGEVQGIIDSSGVKLISTSQLRKYDIGNLFMLTYMASNLHRKLFPTHA